MRSRHAPENPVDLDGVLLFNKLGEARNRPPPGLGSEHHEGSGLMSSESDGPRFPDWFVPDCPPGDADEATGTIYRFVSSNPGGPRDFQSYHETGERLNAPPCQRCGLSVFRRLRGRQGPAASPLEELSGEELRTSYRQA